LYRRYDRLARFYNRHLMGFSQRVLPVLQALLLRQLPPGAAILDLCCGTGQLAGALSRLGYEVTGLDGSPQMLAYARTNAPSATLVAADARDFRFPARFDAAVSIFDSLNHLLKIEELTTAFTNVRSALRSGGRFLFDLNMEPAFALRWNNCLREVDGDEVCEIRSSWDPRQRLGRNHASFYRHPEGCPKGELTMLERCYGEDEVQLALNRAGFTTVASYDAQVDLGMMGEFGRCLFVAGE
jgi:SAM-dependent methyltransferase